MKKIILTLFLIQMFSLTAYGKTFPVAVNQCEKQANNYLKKWLSTAQWKNLLSTDKSVQRFATPTKNFGEWIYLEVSSKGKISKLAKHQQNSMISISFIDNCKEKRTVDQSKKLGKVINDTKLKRMISTYPELLVFIWSPEMTYTNPTFKEIKKLSKKLKIPIKVFLENSAHDKIAMKFLKGQRLSASYSTKIDSFDFRMRGARSHLPVLYYIKKGVVKGHSMAGYKKMDEYVKLINKRRRL